jgi:hypothetical protein
VPTARFFDGNVCFFAAHLVGAAAASAEVAESCPAGTAVSAATR